MALGDLLARLEHVCKAGDGYVARCPVPDHGKGHGDKHPSLSVAERDGKLLLKCFAGCAAEAIVGTLGLDMTDTFYREERSCTHSGTAAQLHRDGCMLQAFADSKRTPAELLQSCARWCTAITRHVDEDVLDLVLVADQSGREILAKMAANCDPGAM